MKLLELRFKNLNSLYGEWVIDFTHPEYESNGIFALTGPTGAGKSTILDAICLALYGATPRLGRITKSNNEIMSRQTGSCYAEVLFASNVGRFRCHWEQRRARSKAEGNLQEAEHQIFDADSGKPIETMKSRVGLVIEEKTGMDFDRFTRSILLAQGSFDSFLKADSEQKSKILEQITGTEMYSEISKRVHERQRKEMDALKLLQAETSGIVILEPEQEKTIREELEEKLHQEKILTSDLLKTNEALLWMKNIENLNKEINDLTQEKEALNRVMETFKPRRAILNNALKASSLEGIYATLSALRSQQAEDKIALIDEESALPEKETSTNNQSKVLADAEQLTIQRKQELQTATPKLKEIHDLDQKIADLEKNVSDEAESYAKDTVQIDADKKILIEEQRKKAESETQKETIEHYLSEHSQDAWLVSGLTGIEEQLGSLLEKQKEIEEKGTVLEIAERAVFTVTKKLKEATTLCTESKAKLEKISFNLQEAKNALKRLLEDIPLSSYRKEKDSLLRELAYIKRIEELESLRTKLEDGKPCPLCGAIEHPFAEGNLPVPDEIEQRIEELTTLITEAEDQEIVISNLVQAENDARTALQAYEKKEASVASQKKSDERTCSEIALSVKSLCANIDEIIQSLLEKLRPLGITQVDASLVTSLRKVLDSRLKAWQEKTKQKAEIEKHIDNIGGEIKHLEGMISTQEKALGDKKNHLDTVKQHLADAKDTRKSLYGDVIPNVEEKRLTDAIANAESAEKSARSLLNELQQNLATARSKVESRNKSIEQRAPKLAEAGEQFLKALRSSDFSDEEAFKEARLSYEERESLSQKARELDNTETALETKLKDRKDRLEFEQGKHLSEATYEDVQAQANTYDESLKQLRDEIATYKHTLQENTAAMERIQGKKLAIESQTQRCARWDSLHNLIGSADGKKYRTFAQGLTFELMVAHANRQLEKMTDRYLLIRDESQPLELNVVDNYQAGEIRSTKNLSGGESFIVSLTLALGLSQMASKKVRVDSLFLDEGFGSLDEETLETALEALSALQQDGKLIGIISHVSALKERISTQISITPLSGGRSTISGPGCNKQQAI
nr:SbcC/MukB-like Walker B domain-containing protein [uncultured Sphaerochaeta sp.]